MDSDARRFNIFLARTLAAHRARLTDREVDVQLFTNAAKIKWETLTKKDKQIITREPPKIAQGPPPRAPSRALGLKPKSIQPPNPIETKPDSGELTADKAPPAQNKRKRGKYAKMKDANAPKRPSTAYIFFSMEERKRIHSENPQLPIPQVMKQIGETWRQMEDKSRYETLAAADTARYHTEMSSYIPPPKVPKKVDVEDLEMPKMPKSGFHMYSMEETNRLCTAFPDLSLLEAMELVTQRWQNLPNRQVYEERAVADYKRYEKEMKKYKLKLEKKKRE